MPTSKRPWWMLHWPSWVALLMFGAAFTMANLLVQTQLESGFIVLGHTAGWPFTFCNIDFSLPPETTIWLWSAESLVRSEVPFAVDVNLRAVVANIAVGVCGVAFVACLTEQYCRRRVS